ncbi:Predicted dehydrogenase [Pedococcus cremeus]|uniref:Predicted dehydrogenase n=1 Tax=Pedococcus cremeus TaxID=587636 RepID=A0A1H9VS91_9MICO|nr:Gfo/Idh/MocA family oxidoreductase [Pedococcus cremeus]SES24428.1 Predicted dehydrogenase [Pedococcus cremeus]
MPEQTLPAPRTPDPMEAPPVRWGILGPGNIAHSFATALREGTRQEVVAVGSRSAKRARDFADEFGVPAAYGSYEELVADEAVDVVYVASPHSEHHEHAMLVLEAGKPVLVEKAFTRNAAEAREVLDTARGRGLFAMEAMWTRFLPHIDVVRQAVESGLLGDVLTVMADHGQTLHPNGPERLSSPDLAGGSLLDLGVYPLSFTSMVLGPFESVTAVGHLTDEGVDAQLSVTVTGREQALGLVGSSMVTKTPTTAVVVGRDARIEIGGDFFVPQPVRLLTPLGEELDRYEPEVREHGFRYEAAEVARCLNDGALESPLMPHAETLRVMEAMDDVRRQVGVRYPGE